MDNDIRRKDHDTNNMDYMLQSSSEQDPIHGLTNSSDHHTKMAEDRFSWRDMQPTTGSSLKSLAQLYPRSSVHTLSASDESSSSIDAVLHHDTNSAKERLTSSQQSYFSRRSKLIHSDSLSKLTMPNNRHRTINQENRVDDNIAGATLPPNSQTSQQILQSRFRENNHHKGAHVEQREQFVPSEHWCDEPDIVLSTPVNSLSSLLATKPPLCKSPKQHFNLVDSKSCPDFTSFEDSDNSLTFRSNSNNVPQMYRSTCTLTLKPHQPNSSLDSVAARTIVSNNVSRCATLPALPSVSLTVTSPNSHSRTPRLISEPHIDEPDMSPVAAPTLPTFYVEMDTEPDLVESINDQLHVPKKHNHMNSHTLLSPMSSLGSGYSRRSSCGDSAIDVRTPDPDQDHSADFSQFSVSPVPLSYNTVPFSSTDLQTNHESSESKHSRSSRRSPSTSSRSSNRSPIPISRSLHGFSDSSSSSRPTTPSVNISDFSQKLKKTLSDHNIRFSDSLELSEEVITLLQKCNMSSTRRHSNDSISSEDSSFSLDEQDVNVADSIPMLKANFGKQWKKIRNIIHWSPFIQHFKKQRYPWVQLAGHQGSFLAGDAGTILKKLTSKEHRCLPLLMHDILRPYVPEFRGVVEKVGEKFVLLQDLLCEFSSPCVMDVKVGVRTYLEDELEKARENPKMRKDLYEKMMEVDENAPTAEEHNMRGIAKPRYMQWRETISSSAELGFRIEGIKKSDGTSSKDFKKTQTWDDVKEALGMFTDRDEALLGKYIQRVKAIRATQETSPFISRHEIIGSSLLFVHDNTGLANVWMIDFGKTTPLPDHVTINHRATWLEGNHEDGYLFGVDNITLMLEQLVETGS